MVAAKQRYSRRNGLWKNWVWTPKVWWGMELRGWMRLLRENPFVFEWKYLHWFALITFAASIHTLLHGVQALVWGKRIRETRIERDPLFIIGHWRTGTTWLHELLGLDEKLTYPTTYECMDPNHFLLTEPYTSGPLGILAPSRRPMDRMPMALDRPQEDEFALCNLGQPSPYLRIAFPNHPQCQEFFDLEEVSADEKMKWRECFLTFLKQITLRRPQRIVLKSPTHTYRINLLLDLFPNAKFIHLVRDPYVIFPSTIHLWRSMWLAHGLQTPSYEGLEEYVLENFVHMHERLDEARPRLHAGNFHELRYEDLVKDPLSALREIYEKLELDDFQRLVPEVEAYLKETSDYETNKYQLSPAMRATITRRWGHVIRRYGYPCDNPSDEVAQDRAHVERDA